MTREIVEKKTERASLIKAMKQASLNGDHEKFEELKEKVKAINITLDENEFVETEEARYGDLETKTPDADPGEEKTKKKVSGFEAFRKFLRREKLTEPEQAQIQKALITGDDAVSGENYLVPADVQTEIHELRRTYVSAKELVNVVPVKTLTGSFPVETGSPSGLIAFDDGDSITVETNPTFGSKSWKIIFYGKLIPISNVLLKHAKTLRSYLNKWFVRNAIISENTKIFATLKAGYNSGTPKAVAGWTALKHSLRVDLDPSCLIDGVIATNQDGFACLDDEVDGNGRPILQPNPKDPTEMIFCGLPVKVYPKSVLPNIDSTHFPIFYGCTKAGADFEEYEDLLFKTSTEYGFDKNQEYLRVIEGFDCISTDTSAYIYGSLSATA